MKILKKLWWLLQLRDGIWSIPLGFFAFYFCGVGLSYIFGITTGMYDPSFIQPLFLAGVVVMGSMNFAIMGVYFNFRRLHHYIYGVKNKELNCIDNNSKKDFESLLPWQRIKISLLVVFSLLFLIVAVYLKLV